MDKATAALKPILLDLYCWQMKYFPQNHVSVSILPENMRISGDKGAYMRTTVTDDHSAGHVYEYETLDAARDLAGTETIYCPECGTIMHFDPHFQRHVCRQCEG